MVLGSKGAGVVLGSKGRGWCWVVRGWGGVG